MDSEAVIILEPETQIPRLPLVQHPSWLAMRLRTRRRNYCAFQLHHKVPLTLTNPSHGLKRQGF